MIKYILTIPTRISLSLFVTILILIGFVIHFRSKDYIRDVKKLYYDIWRK